MPQLGQNRSTETAKVPSVISKINSKKFPKMWMRGMSAFALALMVLQIQLGLVAQHKKKIECTLCNGSATLLSTGI